MRLIVGRRVRAGVELTAALGLAALLPAGAAGAATNLGASGFGSIAVDDAHQHVFVSEPGANQIAVLDFAGNPVGAITAVPGAGAMVISGQALYVAESTAGAIARVDLGALPTSAPPVVASGFIGPASMATTGGALWVSEGPTGQWTADIARLVPATGAVTRFAGNAAMSGYYSPPDLAASPGAASTLFAAVDGLSPGTVSRIDVSGNAPVTAAKNPFGDVSNIEGVAVSSDGTRVIPAAGATNSTPPYVFHEYAAATLQPDGIVYPGNAYPSAVATSPAGLLATGLDNGYSSPDVSVFQLGSPMAVFTASTNNPDGTANVAPHGLALDAAGDRLFAVTTDASSDTIVNAFALPDTAAPVLSCGAVPTGWSNQNVSIPCTASDSGSGLASPSDASFALSTSVAAGSANASATTGTRTVCDVAGNCTTAGPLGPVQVDLAAPTVTITSPVDRSTVKPKTSLVARYSCSDGSGGSGIASCTGTVPNGSTISTSQTGPFAFTVTARDLAGNTTTQTVHYTVSKH